MILSHPSTKTNHTTLSLCSRDLLDDWRSVSKFNHNEEESVFKLKHQPAIAQTLMKQLKVDELIKPPKTPLPFTVIVPVCTLKMKPCYQSIHHVSDLDSSQQTHWFCCPLSSVLFVSNVHLSFPYNVIADIWKL